MQTPDITPIQKLVAGIVTLLGSVLTLLVAFGVDLSGEQMAAILGVATSLGSVLILADAIIRNGRARIAANPEALKLLEQPGRVAVNR